MASGMIVLLQGKRGSGKTLTVVELGLEYLEEGWKIYRNFSLPFGEYLSNEQILEFDRDSDFRDCVILIDEMQILFDSRLWNSKSSIKFSHFIQQLRKRNIVIIGSTQYVDTVEKRIRQHVDIIIQPSFDEDLNVCSYTATDLTSFESGELLYYEVFYDAEPIFSLYDTKEIIG